jgi:hypothetical protein
MVVVYQILCVRSTTNPFVSAPYTDRDQALTEFKLWFNKKNNHWCREVPLNASFEEAREVVLYNQDYNDPTPTFVLLKFNI